MDTLDIILFLVLFILIALYFMDKPKVITEDEKAEIIKQGGDITDLEQVVSFLIPLAGFIIYAINSSERPYKAKKALVAASWGFGLGILFVVIGWGLLFR